jgi:hypothetical protein
MDVLVVVHFRYNVSKGIEPVDNEGVGDFDHGKLGGITSRFQKEIHTRD